METANEAAPMFKTIMGIVIVVVIVLAGVGVVLMLKNTFDEKSESMMSAVNSTSMLEYDSYNDKDVLGSAITTALKTYASTDFIIAIQNNKGTTVAYDPDATASGDETYYYGCVPSSISASGSVYKGALTYDNVLGYFAVDSLLEDSNNEIIHVRNLSATTNKNAPATYVSSTAKYHAQLIVNTTSGDVCGVLFRQMKK